MNKRIIESLERIRLEVDTLANIMIEEDSTDSLEFNNMSISVTIAQLYDDFQKTEYKGKCRK